MKPVQDISTEETAQIKYILTDIDDTLTDKGKILSETFDALWNLSRAGFICIPITGRPAGWCDCIVRQWPVSGIIGENGAFAFFMDNGTLQRMYHPSAAPEEVRLKLQKLGEEVVKKVPGSRIAKDQFSRMFDLGIDFNEEPPYLSLDDAERIKQVCEDYGATAKVSSIHVNAWFGNYSKLDMTLLFLKKRYGITAEDARIQCCFCGDSPNDEPMFEYFPVSCGVGNIAPFLGSLKAKPGFITKNNYGLGFVEFAGVFLKNTNVRNLLKKYKFSSKNKLT